MVKVEKTQLNMCVLHRLGETDDVKHTILHRIALDGFTVNGVQLQGIGVKILKIWLSLW